MAQIISYPRIADLSAEDTLLVADVSESNNPTKTASMSDVCDLVLGYTAYSAYFIQQGTGAPTLNVMQNTTNTTFTGIRSTTGQYGIQAATPAALPTNKVFVNIQGSRAGSPSPAQVVQPTSIDHTNGIINFRAFTSSTGTLVDDNQGWIEIRIYS